MRILTIIYKGFPSEVFFYIFFTHLFISFLGESIYIETYLSIYLFIYSSVSSLSSRSIYLVAYVHACSVDFEALYIASVLYFSTTFAYNNNVHASIKKTLHELLKKYITSFAETSENKTLKRKTFLITKWAEWLRSIRKHLMRLWKWVAKQQAKYYNAHHKVASFQMKDKVLLQSINIHTLWLKKKIDYKQLKSFRILKKIDMQAYKLELSEKYDVIHLIFHVSLLKFWYLRDENSKLQIILVRDLSRAS